MFAGVQAQCTREVHSGDFSNGCARNSVLCGENDMFFPVYMMSGDDNLKTVSVEDDSACKKECLKSCDCKAYSFDNRTDDCSIMTRDLVDLREYAVGHLTVSVRVAISEIGTNPFHMSLLAFTEFLKLQLPAAVYGFDCFTSLLKSG